MTQSEAEKLIKRMKGAFTFNKFDDPDVTLEFTRVLLRMDYQNTNTALDVLIYKDSKNAPAISELIKAAKENKKTATEVKNVERCWYCNDCGLIPFWQTINDSQYEMFAACPKCEVGKSMLYDGSQCKDHKSTYSIKFITEFLPDEVLEDIKKSNMNPLSFDIRALRQKIATVGGRI